jgi:two-component system, OmpR family, phosphate regulon sensor histidine kinase PhoR
MSTSQTAMLVLDHSGVLRDASPAALQIMRASREQILGTCFVQLLDEGSRSKGRALLEAARQGPTRVYELVQILGDGHVELVGYQAVPLAGTGTHDQGGILLLAHPLAHVASTTERLLALNRRLRALFTITASASRSLLSTQLLQQALSIAMAELDLRAGAVVLLEPVAEGTPPDDQAPSLMLAAQQGLLVSREQPHPLVTFARTRLLGSTTATISGSAQELGLRTDNLVFPDNPLLHLAATPLRSDDRLLGWMLVLAERYPAFASGEVDTLQTISNVLGAPIENARLYEMLLETTGQLQAVLDGIDSGVVLVDRDGVVRYANSGLGRMLDVNVEDWPGYPRGELFGARLTRLKHPSTSFAGDFWEYAGPPRRVLRRFVDQVADQNGAPIGSIEVYTDVTTLEEMNKLKDEFVAAAAHDLKTPVSAIKGYAQIALRLARRVEEQRLVKPLEMINARSDDLAYLMDSLLDVSRIQAGRLRLDLDTFELGDLVRKVVRHFDFDLQRHGRAINVDLPSEALEVFWDQHRVERMLINLLGNAIKYSPDGGQIDIRVRVNDGDTGEPPGLVEIAITDHGIGIPPDERERVFERFYRVRQTVEDGFKGTGLGLHICASVVHALGGTIRADASLHGGQGTTIYVVLPQIAVPTDDST